MKRNKFATNIGFNLFSYAFFALFGILLNVIIITFYNPAILGYFNTIYALYIVLSQFSVFGQNYAVLSLVSNAESIHNKKEYLYGSLTVAFIISMIVIMMSAIIIFLSIISNFNIQFIFGFAIVVLALPFFSLNKVLIGYLTGTFKLKQQAIFNTLRMALILAIILLIVFFHWPYKYLPTSFLFAEIILLLIILIYLILYDNFKFKPPLKNKLDELFKFGYQALPIGLIAEVNTRIDVLCLSVFLNSTQVGIYSFALMFAEGVYQIYVVIRQVSNPYIVKKKKEKKYIYKDFFASKFLKINYILGFLFSLLFIVLYRYVVLRIFAEYYDSLYVFLILLIGIWLTSFYIIMGNYFVINKKPEFETKISLIVVFTNTVMNVVLIPLIGIKGAALGTICSYFANVIAQEIYAKKLKI